MTLPHWSKDVRPELYQRTTTKYAEHEFKADIQSILIPGVIVAGGYVRSLVSKESNPNGDIDLYFDSDVAWNNFYDLIEGNVRPDFLKGYSTTISRSKADQSDIPVVTFTANGKPDIQMIKIVWVDGAEHAIDTFDFTVCQFALENDKLYFNPKSYGDLYSKTLNIHRTIYDCDLENRIVKYIRKGFTPSRECWDALKLELMAMDTVSLAEPIAPTALPYRVTYSTATISSGNTITYNPVSLAPEAQVASNPRPRGLFRNPYNNAPSDGQADAAPVSMATTSDIPF